MNAERLLEHRNIVIDGVNIHYVTNLLSKDSSDNDSTTSAPVMVFLHGFPEYWQTWQNQLDFFKNNYRVIAPDLPGYHQSDKPKDTNFYTVPNLIAFFAKFIKNTCPNQKVILVAHDWGGAIAWPLVAFHPNLFSKLVILNAAHPSTFTREMINNPVQREKSSYIHDLIADDAQALLSKNNYDYLTNKIMIGSSSNTFSEQTREQYRLAWQQTGAITGMLQYYKAMPQLAPSNSTNHAIGKHSPIKSTAEMKVPNIRIETPTLILWGEQDQAFVKENLEGIEQYVPNCTIKRFAEASHWLMHEKSPQINNNILTFIEK